MAEHRAHRRLPSPGDRPAKCSCGAWADDCPSLPHLPPDIALDRAAANRFTVPHRLANKGRWPTRP